MRLDRDDLVRMAADLGFGAEPLEKVLRLVELLADLGGHPYLRDRLVLKGGTALNLFLSDVPRLSVDIDLNYIGSADLATMQAERPEVERAIAAVCGRLGLQVTRVPSEHAGGKWRVTYTGAAGNPGTLELDINYLLRVPLWPPMALDSRPLGPYGAKQVRIVDLHELVAGKLAALLGRSVVRDVFDARELLGRDDLDPERLRLGFVVFGAMQRRDWREVRTEDVEARLDDVRSQLLPLLRTTTTPPAAEVRAWVDRLVAQCRERLSSVLPLRPEELRFVEEVNSRGEIAPELLTDDPDLQARIRTNPGLLWKAQKVRTRPGHGAGAGTAWSRQDPEGHREGHSSAPSSRSPPPTPRGRTSPPAPPPLGCVAPPVQFGGYAHRGSTEAVTRRAPRSPAGR